MQRWILSLSLLLAPGLVLAQDDAAQPERKNPWVLSVYLSTWLNRCDVPAASQFSKRTPAVGPTFALSKGRLRFSMSGYLGEYKFERSDFRLIEGQSNPQFTTRLPGNTLIAWDNSSAQERGFSVDGKTQRQDLSMGMSYRFNNAFAVGLSLEYNHRKADYRAFLPLAIEPAKLPPPAAARYTPQPIEGDPQGRALLSAPGQYNIHQLWIGPQVSGFTPLSSRMGGFYNASALLLAYESDRAPVYLDENGNFFPPGLNEQLLLKPRSFGDNFGAAFSMGISYSILPRMAVWGGYSLKFFAEENTALLDNSIYQGPYFGVGYIFQ